MSAQGSQLKSILGISALVSFYGIASLAILFIGPSFGISFVWQIIFIALLLVTWPFAILINHLSKRRARKHEAAKAAALDPRAPQEPITAGAAPKRVYEELTRGAEEVVQWLRSTRLGGTKSSQALYALPWYVVAGPPASGKTSLVLSSGLDFHALPSQRRAEMKIVRPTHHCEWRVTDSAVLIDTAGRYQGDGPARDEWIALTETLKKHRDVRALDGVVLALNADLLLRSNDTELEQLAKTVRARLDEMAQLVRARFPVYLVFTNIDKLEGFNEFFKHGRSEGEVWGATIPLEKMTNAHALFDVEFDQLYESLLRIRLLRLRLPAAALTQLRIFDFPVRFAETRQKLAIFVSALFRPNPFRESPLLRGFYFTANVTTGRGPLAHPVSEDGEKAAHAVGTGFFTDRFFKEVVLRDKDLAASFQSSQKKPPKTGATLLILGAILLFGLLVGSMVSYLANRKLLAEATARGLRVDEIRVADKDTDVTKKSATAARVEIETLDSLREILVELEATPPLYMRFGLYSGDDVVPDLRTIYFEAVEKRFKEPMVEALELDLRNFAMDQPSSPAANSGGTTGLSGSEATPSQEEVLGRHYDRLKAYLMLADATKVEPAFLASTISDYWKRTAPPDTENLSLQELDFYARQLVRDDAPHIKVNAALVSEARRKLAAYPPINRFYKRLVTEINTKTAAVSIDGVLEGRGRGILNGTYTVPGSYTIGGYRDYMKSSIENAREEITRDDWVMGTVATSNDGPSSDIGKLQDLYFRDYTDQWRKFLRGISVRSFKTKDDAVEALRAISATDSPMELVLSEVASNVNLSKKPKSSGPWAWIKSWFWTSTDDGLGGNTEVEKEFRPLFQFLGSGEQKQESSPMSQYRAELGRVLDPLELSSENQLLQTSQALLTGKDELGLQKTQQTISTLLQGFKTAAATDAADLLKQPMQNMREFLNRGGIQQVVTGWDDQIYPKARDIEEGYPFTDEGEASLVDLSGFLNPENGQFSTFFNQKLASSFDDAQGQWRLKESGAIKFSNDFVKYLNSARKLREALFANGGKQPEVGYELTLHPVPNAQVVMEIDGLKVETRGNSPQPAKFTWPARSGNSGVRIRIVRAGDNQTADKTFPGTWGLFKMVEAGSRQSLSADYVLVWDVEGVEVRATLRPASANNPFQRTLFKNLRAPQNLQK